MLRSTIAAALLVGAVGITGGGAAVAARRPSGIDVKVNDQGTLGRKIATVRSGKCRLRRGSFSFHADARGLSLDVDIDDWKGYRHTYLLTVDSKGKVFVDRANQSNGAYSSEFAIPGSKTGTVSAVRFRRKGSVIRIGAPDLPNFDYSRFLYLRGAARCERR